MKAYLPLNHLKAALLFAAVKDIRERLCGVLVEFYQSQTLVVATDGVVLCAIRSDPTHGEANFTPTQIIVPRWLCEAAVKTKAECVEITVGPATSGARSISLGDGTSTIVGETIDATPVQWRLVVPDKCTGGAAQIDPLLLARFSKAGKLLGHPRISVGWNGAERASLVTLEGSTDFVGAIAHFRVATVLECPSWVRL